MGFRFRFAVGVVVCNVLPVPVCGSQKSRPIIITVLHNLHNLHNVIAAFQFSFNSFAPPLRVIALAGGAREVSQGCCYNK